MLRPQFLNMNFHNFLETVPIFIFRTAPGSFRYRKHSWEKLPVNTINDPYASLNPLLDQLTTIQE